MSQSQIRGRQRVQARMRSVLSMADAREARSTQHRMQFIHLRDQFRGMRSSSAQKSMAEFVNRITPERVLNKRAQMHHTTAPPGGSATSWHPEEQHCGYGGVPAVGNLTISDRKPSCNNIIHSLFTVTGDKYQWVVIPLQNIFFFRLWLCGLQWLGLQRGVYFTLRFSLLHWVRHASQVGDCWIRREKISQIICNCFLPLQNPDWLRDRAPTRSTTH